MKLDLSERAKGRWIGGVITLLCLGLGAAGIGDVVAITSELTTKPFLVTVDHYTTLPLFLAPPLLPIGLILLLGKEADRTARSKGRSRAQKAEADRQSRWGQWYVLYLFISILAALFSPVPQFLIMDHLLSERGYVFCPAPLLARHAPDHWALPGPHGPKEHCPKES